MKKIFLVVLILFSLIVGMNILKILVIDLDRLTEYGYGYLVGKIIIFLALSLSAYFVGKSIFKKRRRI